MNGSVFTNKTYRIVRRIRQNKSETEQLLYSVIIIYSIIEAQYVLLHKAPGYSSHNAPSVQLVECLMRLKKVVLKHFVRILSPK